MWFGWSPTIWVERPRPGERVQHTLHDAHPHHLFGGGRPPAVASEAIGPAVAASAANDATPADALPAVSAGPAAGESKPGFFRRVFGGSF